jgi:hypothetical protein
MNSLKKWWARTQWIVIPIAVFSLVEVAVRYEFDETPLWYAAAAPVAAAGRIDVIFTGSSRVREGVYTPAFDAEIYRSTASCPRTLNLARGYTTAAEHYLGLRNLFAQHPASVDGLTVFIEAPGGLPAFETWDDPWANESQLWLITDLLRIRDLPKFWGSGHSAEDKIRLSLRGALQNIAAVNRRERIRAELQQGGVTWLASMLNDDAPPNPFAENSVATQLLGTGGTLHDEKSVILARDLAVRTTEQALREQQPLASWNPTIVHDIVKLVQKQNGKVVFFDVPLSGAFKRLYTTPVRRADMAAFRSQAEKWGASVLVTDLDYTDKDLPDLWHVRKELALKFSSELARAWTHAIGGGSARPSSTTCKQI